MKNRSFSPWNSPLFSACLVCACAALLLAMRGQQSREIAPNVAGYNWKQHPNTLLIIQRAASSCGCTPKLSELALTGLSHDLDVLVVANPQAGEGEALKRAALSPRVSIVMPIPPELLKRFCPQQQELVMVRVRDGRITRTAQDGLPSESFFTR